VTELDALDALLVALGAAVGAPLRYVVNHVVRERFGGTPVAGTLVVNVAGSFVLGLLVGFAADGWPLVLVGTGFCGALTTFSTLALEIWDAMSDDRYPHAAANVVLSLSLGLGAAWLGWSLASP
jgi:CrcB protein